MHETHLKGTTLRCINELSLRTGIWVYTKQAPPTLFRMDVRRSVVDSDGNDRIYQFE